MFCFFALGYKVWQDLRKMITLHMSGLCHLLDILFKVILALIFLHFSFKLLDIVAHFINFEYFFALNTVLFLN